MKPVIRDRQTTRLRMDEIIFAPGSPDVSGADSPGDGRRSCGDLELAIRFGPGGARVAGNCAGLQALVRYPETDGASRANVFSFARSFIPDLKESIQY